MRLDVYLSENKIVKSRELAKKIISEGGISVNGITSVKPSREISESDKVELIGRLPVYVGRGGLKLKKALDCFNIDLSGLVCMDIGASTGGFTDCMLQSGAEYVYAVDVGHGQLDESLVSDERVKNMEGVNIKDVSPSDFSQRIDFIGTDVSFISLAKVIPKIQELLSDGCGAVMLVKPQFECGRGDIGKNGVVRSKKAHLKVVKDICSCCGAWGMGVKGLDFSPIRGGEGNIEFLIYAVKGVCPDVFDCEEIVAAAHKER